MRLDTKIKLVRLAIFVASITLIKIGLLPTPLGDEGGYGPW
jgi:hypothetical protein